MTARDKQAAAERRWRWAEEAAIEAEARARRWGCPRNSEAADRRREERQAWDAVCAAREAVAWAERKTA